MKIISLATAILFLTVNAFGGEVDHKERLNLAAVTACSIDILRTDSQMNPPLFSDKYQKTRQQIWLNRFNDFQTTDSGADLLKYAESVFQKSETRHVDAVCRVLVPTWGLSISAATLTPLAENHQSGSLLSKCGDKYCVPEAIADIENTCEVYLGSTRYHELCFGIGDAHLAVSGFSSVDPDGTVRGFGERSEILDRFNQRP